MAEKVACQICQRVKEGSKFNQVPGIEGHFCHECWRLISDYFSIVYRGVTQNG